MKDPEEFACIARVNKWLSKKGKGGKKGRKQRSCVPPMGLLYEAAGYGHSEAVKALLDAGADVEAKNANGNFALIFAAQEGHPEVVKLLLNAGADKDAQTTDPKCFGYTPLDLATECGCSEVGGLEANKVLLNAGASFRGQI